MKFTKLIMPLILLLAFSTLTSCDNDDDSVILIDDGIAELDSKVFALGSVAVPEISGTATFINNEDDTTTITLALENTPAGGMHPAHIHINTAAEGGAIALTLGTVDGDTGIGTITTGMLDDGTAISYDELLAFDGYINVHFSADDLGTLVAQGDVGQNVLTGETKTFGLAEVDVPGIDGDVTFSERMNGEALAVITLSGTLDGGMHPAHIHANTAVEGGGILFTFNPVIGSTGISKTNVAQLDDETSFSYADVLDLDGYVNVHLSADDLGTLVAQGDIGQNELTGVSTTYQLEERDVAGISGEATFFQRANGSALAIIALEGTPDGGMHPAHIHANDAETGGPIVFTFPPVDGTTGMSKVQVETLDDDTVIGYDSILTFNGYINVHVSADDLGTLVAQGNIGSNI